MKKAIVVSVTAFAFLAISTTVLFTSCQKKNIVQTNQVNPNTNKILLPNTRGCWYFGTTCEFNGGCCAPSSPFCHTGREKFPTEFGQGTFGFSAYQLQPNGNLKVEIDVTDLYPSILTDWETMGLFQVPVSSELDYGEITQAYNNEGINQNIPHYFMPAGNWPITFTNIGSPTKTLVVEFVNMNTIQINLIQ